MATYAIGDVQGCYTELEQLLDAVAFDPTRDRAWFVGDVVNRGPQSLACLRLVKDLGDAAVMVLGNHDLHLLMVAQGHAKLHRNDTIADILGAPDRDALLNWLRRRPLLHVEGGVAMVHAGLLPGWSVARAKALAQEVEAVLPGPDFGAFCTHMYGNQPDRWDDALQGWDRLRVIVNVMTRLRVTTADGVMEFRHKGRPADAPPGFVPWYQVPARRSADHFIVCGHWSAQGLLLTETVATLDTGCLWGGQLTALRLEDRKVFQVSCAAPEGAKRWR